MSPPCSQRPGPDRAATSLGPFSGCMQIFDPAPEGKVSARLRSPPHIPTPADAIATRSHLPLLTVLAGMPFVVFPPPSHKLHLGSPRGGDGTRSLRERVDWRIGIRLPSSARVRQATCVHSMSCLIGNQIGPGLPWLRPRFCEIYFKIRGGLESRDFSKF